MRVDIIQSVLTLNPCYTANRKITVQGLMLHSVGCPQPNASVFIKNWNKESYNSACVHGFIDANTGAIYQTLPWDHRGWHCASGNKGSGNNTHIGIEMCEPACIKYISGATFECYDKEEAIAAAKRTWDSAVKLFAYLCKLYNLNPLADGVIISHKEGYYRGIASGHGDPSHMWEQLGMTEYTMDTFRSAVKNAMLSIVVESETQKTEIANTLKGANNEEKIWNYLCDNLKNKYGVAGLMGNLYAESGLSPINLQNTYNTKLNYTDQGYTDAVDKGEYSNFIKDSAGYGLAQWTYWSRKEGLYVYAKSKGVSIGDLGAQLEYLMKELKESYSSTVLTHLKNAKTVRSASDIVLTKFERPADQSSSVQKKRAEYGQIYYDKYVNDKSIIENKPNTTPSNNNTTPSNNKNTSETTSKMYVVQVGAYLLKANANQIQKRLEKAGFETAIVLDGIYYRVQVGAFSNKTNATNMVIKLNKAGFKAIIKEK